MEPTLASVLRRRWKETRSTSSWWKSAREVATDVWEFAKEATPQRRRALFGDAEYDWSHHVNTTSGAVSQRTRLLAAIAGAPYQPTEPSIFAEMLQALDIDFPQFTFIDIGSGKGRTLLMAAEWPFRRIVGVELLPELHAVAVQNVAKAGFSARIETLCVDARDYVFPLEPLLVYLFNPLPATALQRVVENLRTSLLNSERPLRVLYHNPQAEHVLANTQVFKKLVSTYQFAIYSN